MVPLSQLKSVGNPGVGQVGGQQHMRALAEQLDHLVVDVHIADAVRESVEAGA